MAEQLLEQVRDAVEGQIVRRAIVTVGQQKLANTCMQDFEGQRLAEMLTTVMLGAAGVRSRPPAVCVDVACSPSQIVAFIVGYLQQDIKLTLYIGLAGTALTFAVVVPPWPFYNKNPEDWLPPHNATSTSGINIDVDGQKVG